ncbi:hypothetical protein ACFQU1_25330 [Chelatococcus sp. GCM10030263]|uniref:hypothetical protein n=1 Tax=Chelatococcus sp. GCM10030263 TaxID=3273387 RepID=UPI0036147F89
MVKARPILCSAVIAVLLACLPVPALAVVAEADPANARLQISVETPKDSVYPREMVLLRIRGAYRTQMGYEHVEQPELRDFTWFQLGRDRWFPSDLDGFQARGFERRIALFPQRSGRLDISPFIHHLMLPGSERDEITVTSNATTLDVAPLPAQAGDWWLPARSVTVTDQWDPAPETLQPGGIAQRTVTIEAVGVNAEQLPPQPRLSAPKAVIFPGQGERETRIGSDGPVGRAVYRWEVRPILPHLILDEVEIPWFDTVQRTMRTAILPARRLAWGAGSEENLAVEASAASHSRLLVGAGIAAFIAGLVVMFAGTTPSEFRARLPRRAPPQLKAMRAAARRGDQPAFRRAVSALARDDRDAARHWMQEPEVAGGLARLDARLFAGVATEAEPDLRALARAIEQAWRRSRKAEMPEPAGLAPLDG